MFDFQLPFVAHDDAHAHDQSVVDAGLPVAETDYWICTCGFENVGTEHCEQCALQLHERDPHWATEPVLGGDEVIR